VLIVLKPLDSVVVIVICTDSVVIEVGLEAFALSGYVVLRLEDLEVGRVAGVG
jgi:hypothetical protein